MNVERAFLVTQQDRFNRFSISNDGIKQEQKKEKECRVDARVCFSIFMNYHQRSIKQVRKNTRQTAWQHFVPLPSMVVEFLSRRRNLDGALINETRLTSNSIYFQRSDYSRLICYLFSSIFSSNSSCHKDTYGKVCPCDWSALLCISCELHLAAYQAREHGHFDKGYMHYWKSSLRKY